MSHEKINPANTWGVSHESHVTWKDCTGWYRGMGEMLGVCWWAKNVLANVKFFIEKFFLHTSERHRQELRVSGSTIYVPSMENFISLMWTLGTRGWKLVKFRLWFMKMVSQHMVLSPWWTYFLSSMQHWNISFYSNIQGWIVKAILLIRS